MNGEEERDWDRQPGESSKAYSHFCLYRDMGPDRSLRKVPTLSECRAVVGQLWRWSSKWRWVQRCEKYDDYLEYQDRLRQEKERRQMRDRHAKMAVLAQNIAVEGLKNLLAKVQDGEQGVAPADLTRLLDTGVRVERLSRGEPTEIEKSEHTGSLDIEARYRTMTPEERRAELVRIFRDELGKTEEEAEDLADGITEAKQ
jgi:hypothetical protein